MQEQLSELQQKLAKEEEDKVTVSKLNDELRTTSQELDKVTIYIQHCQTSPTLNPDFPARHIP